MEHSELKNYQIGIICALPLEMKAVRAVLDEEYMVPMARAYRDNNTYILGRVHQHDIVLACLPSGEYGTVSAGSVSRDMLWAFPYLRISLLVGIAGGIPDFTQNQDIRLGDVVVGVPERTFGGVVQYDLGKATKNGRFERVGSLNKAPAVLLTALSALRSDPLNIRNQIADQILQSQESHPGLIEEDYKFPGFDQDKLMCSGCDSSQWWWLLWCLLVCICPLLRCQSCEGGVVKRKMRVNEDPHVHYGTVASGNSVVKDVALRDRLSRELGAKCVEMEASGIMDNYPCLVVRGICDYADHHKLKTWQKYASLTAAAFAKELLRYVSMSETQLEKPIRQHLEAVEKHLEHLGSRVKDDEERRRAKEARFREQRYLDCHRAFKTTQYSEAKMAVPERVSGTCKWVTNHEKFKLWQESSTNDLLWISADPGCGKSVLVRSLIDDDIIGSASHHVCYFFFKDIEERSTLSAALCAWIHQLLVLEPQLLDLAVPVWEKHKFRVADEIDDLWALLLNASESSEVGNITFILDAVDECCEADRKRLLQYLVGFYKKTSMIPSRLPRIKFLVTSRPYDDIRVGLALPQQFPSIRLRGEEETGSIRPEINLVIQQRVQKLANDLSLGSHIRDRLANELTNMKNRTYLWLHLVIEGIYEDFRDSYCPEDEMINNLPATVEQAYEDILRRVKDRKKVDVKNILKIVIGAKRSLTVEEMAHALGIAVSFKSDMKPRRVDIQHLEQQIRDWCGLFITIEDTRIYLFHQTAKEFLLKPKTIPHSHGDSWQHSLDVTEVDELMTWICTSYLLTLPTNDSLPSFFGYSARNWSIHARTSKDCTAQGQVNKMVRLFDSSWEGHTLWINHYLNHKRDWKRISKGHKIHPVTFVAANGLLRLLEVLLAHDDFRAPAVVTQALEYASRMGETKAIQMLIRYGADIRSCQGRALLWAADQGQIDVVQLLIDYGAHINSAGQQPIAQAAIKGHKDIVDLLAANGADVNANKGQALIRMASRGLTDTVRNLLDYGADIDFGRAVAISEATIHGHLDIVKLLLNHRPQTSSFMANLLDEAVEYGHAEIVGLILEYEILPEKIELALSHAAYKGHPDVTRLLLEQQSYTDARKNIALYRACEGKGNIEVVKLLLQYGAGSVPDGWDCIVAAASIGATSVVQLLIEYGVDGDYVDASYTAHLYGHFETELFLRKNGRDFDVWTVDIRHDRILPGLGTRSHEEM